MVAALPVVSLQRVSQMEHKYMLHATYRLKMGMSYKNKRHLPMRDRCPYELDMLLKRPKIISCRTFPSLTIMSCLLLLKAYLNLGLLGLAQMPITFKFEGLFVIVQVTSGIYNQKLGCLIKGLCYFLENQESKSYITQPLTDPQFGKDLKQGLLESDTLH
jgi:hypothetical protein